MLMMVLVTVGLGSGAGLVAAEPPTTDDSSQVAESTTVWPRRATVDGWIITVYQPQPERLDGNLLTARAAVSIAKDNGEPLFGAEWLSIRLDIDRELRVANAVSLTVDRIQFSAGEASDDAAAMQERLQRALVPADLTFNLDDLIATLEQEPTDRSIYRIAPPHILIRTTPTELVPFDGPPRFETAGGVTLAINTPAFVCLGAYGEWWLRLDRGWLTAPDGMGPWMLASAPAAVAAAAESAGLKPTMAPSSEAMAPTVILSTEPTELVVFNGEPQWTPIADTGILAAENASRDAFIDTATRRYWLLLAGRWCSAERLADDASWVAVAPNALPAGFAAIPADSRWAHVRVHISGTEEARKAALDAQVPQTARIPRSSTITVTYDGEPRFTPIPASDVAWAENSSFAVFRTPGPLYWCCEQGVWYQAVEPHGPWTVATNIPDALYRIPADNPNHNVTYVYVYDSGPDYVWTGYTSGYVHHYIYHGCPIYGSGYYWHGYYGRSGYSCARPITWGVRVAFNPWYCSWGIGSVYHRGSVGNVVYVGGHSHGGWWGPTRHVPTVVTRVGYRPLPASTIWPGTVYQHSGQRVTTALPRNPTIYRQVPGAQVPNRQSRQVPDADNRAVIHNPGEPVFASRDGAIIRRSDSGTWQERHNRTWNDLPTTIERDAGRGQGATNRDERLPRIATRQPVSDQRPPQQLPRPTRPPNNPQVEPPVIRPQPPTARPQQPSPELPRPQTPERRPNDPPTNQQPPSDRPQQLPPPRQPELPRPQQPERRPNDRPTNQQPPSDRPQQLPPPRQPELPRPQLPVERPTQPPTNRPQPPTERPQPPPRQPELPRPQQPVERPIQPPTIRRPPPTERPTPPPPRRPSEDPRPQLPQNFPANPPTTRQPPPIDRPQQQQPPRQPEQPRPQLPVHRPPEPVRTTPPPAPPSRLEQPPIPQPRPHQAEPPSRPAVPSAPRQQPAPQPRSERETPRTDEPRSREKPLR